MLITVVICTRDRASMLRQALQSLVACRRPLGPDDWEVLVVDNASNDDTPSVVAEFRGRLPVRYAREDQPGLSHARNHGVRDARGVWIAWLDDDVTVDTDWLSAYVDAIASRPDATVFGGSIAIHLEGSPPAWLRAGIESLQDAYAGRSAEQCRGQFFVRGEKPYGANFALRRTAAQIAPFDPRLGRHPSRPVMGGEETQVIRTVLSSGTGWWVPEARVVHHIDAARQSAAYLWRYFVCSGESSARGWYTLPTRQRWCDLLIAVKRGCVAVVGYLVLALLHINRSRAHALRDSAWYAGYTKACVRTLIGPQTESATP